MIEHTLTRFLSSGQTRKWAQRKKTEGILGGDCCAFLWCVLVSVGTGCCTAGHPVERPQHAKLERYGFSSSCVFKMNTNETAERYL